MLASADQMIHLTPTVSAGLNYTSTVSDCFRPLINQLTGTQISPGAGGALPHLTPPWQTALSPLLAGPLPRTCLARR